MATWLSPVKYFPSGISVGCLLPWYWWTRGPILSWKRTTHSHISVSEIEYNLHAVEEGNSLKPTLCNALPDILQLGRKLVHLHADKLQGLRATAQCNCIHNWWKAGSGIYHASVGDNQGTKCIQYHCCTMSYKITSAYRRLLSLDITPIVYKPNSVTLQ